MSTINAMLLTYSLEKVFKALQILLPKMKRKSNFKIDKTIFTFLTQCSTCTPITNLTNSFFEKINEGIL